ncbi:MULTISPECIES: DUF998 domain-containing protein [Actinokineospora]|uniref:DUF998 domain-containing protein n=1 Tax=Actinokineospora fastidiosa TaxID=1816 RepID=A0A918GK66_9PSEU|nr:MULTISPECIES: DUF998 domain-containing protein [Actinokineospora]UVS77569.1 hypothetical protein Actkin_01283 [Actinokineospora sp. UTMC 2448]GGS42456.1 hypothetical protein GCM10010171_41670 [Actinokineospora fastidiosa]
MSPIHDNLVHSYLYLRRAIGLIGMALPVVLVLGQYLIDGRLLHSISGYYYSDLRDVYVGSMCAIGVFLLSYRGYAPVDDLVSNIAAVAAIGVALFPTAPPSGATASDEVFAVLHLAFAGVFFLSLAYFCLVLFRRSTGEDPTTERKVKRNGVYVLSGVVILASLALMVILGLFFQEQTEALRPALWLEFAATFAFGTAWLTKGELILPDTGGDRSTAVGQPAV